MNGNVREIYLFFFCYCCFYECVWCLMLNAHSSRILLENYSPSCSWVGGVVEEIAWNQKSFLMHETIDCVRIDRNIHTHSHSHSHTDTGASVTLNNISNSASQSLYGATIFPLFHFRFANAEFRNACHHPIHETHTQSGRFFTIGPRKSL